MSGVLYSIYSIMPNSIKSYFGAEPKEKQNPPQGVPITVTPKTWNSWKNDFTTQVPIYKEDPSTNSKKIVGYKMFVKDPSQNNLIVSEGMAYGLLLAVQMNDQETFDEILRGLKDMEGNGMPVWKGYIENNRFVVKCDSGKASASDAEQDIAMALIQAQTKLDSWRNDTWQDPKDLETEKTDDKYYGKMAQKYLDVIWGKEVTQSGESYILKPSEDWGYVPGGTISNPSYITPLWYDYFAAFDREPSHRWMDLKNYSYQLIETAFNSYKDINADNIKNKLDAGGLLPDWCKAIYRENGFQIYAAEGMDSRMGYNAIRIFWRVSQDAIYNPDAAQRKRAVLLCRDFVDSFKDRNIADLKLHTTGDDDNGKKVDMFLNNYAVISMMAMAANAAAMPLDKDIPANTQIYRDWDQKLRAELVIRKDALLIRKKENPKDPQYFDESLLVFSSLVIGRQYSNIASNKIVPKDSSVIATIRERHRPYPIYFFEGLPVIGPAIMPAENSSRLWLDGTRNPELVMLIDNINWLKGKDPKDKEAIDVRMNYCDNLRKWGYYDEAIKEYGILLANVKYSEKGRSASKDLEMRKIIRDAVGGLMDAFQKSNNTEAVLPILTSVAGDGTKNGFDPTNIYVLNALAKIYSFQPQKKFEKMSLDECVKGLKMAASLKTDDPQIVTDLLTTFSQVLAKQGRNASDGENYTLSSQRYLAVKSVLDKLAMGRIDRETISSIESAFKFKDEDKLTPGEALQLNKTLSDLTPQMKDSIRVTEADLLSGILGEMLMIANISVDISNDLVKEATEDKKTDRYVVIPTALTLDSSFVAGGQTLRSFLLKHMEEPTEFYRRVLKNSAPPNDLYKMAEKQLKDLYNGEDSTELIFKSCMGIMRSYSFKGKLAGAADTTYFDAALAANDIILENVSSLKGKGTSGRLLENDDYQLISTSMRTIAKNAMKNGGKAIETEVRTERIQLLNDKGDYRAAITEYEDLLKDMVSIGRIRPHFERIIYFIQNMEYNAAVSDCDFLLAAVEPLTKGLPSDKESLVDRLSAEILTEAEPNEAEAKDAQANISRAMSLMLDVLKDDDYIRTGSFNASTRKKYEEINTTLGQMVPKDKDTPAAIPVSPRNTAILRNAIKALGQKDNDGNVINARFGDAYDLLTTCLEINRFLKEEEIRIQEKTATEAQVLKELLLLKELGSVRALLQDGKVSGAQKLCDELVRSAEKELGEVPPKPDVQKTIILEASPKYALALARSGDPFGGIAVYKSLLNLDYSFAEIGTWKAEPSTTPAPIGNNVKRTLMSLEDKELKGYADNMFKSSPYLKNSIVTDLANLYIWKETRDAFVHLDGKNRVGGKLDAFAESNKYYVESDKNDPTNVQVIRMLRNLNYWTYEAKKKNNLGGFDINLKDSSEYGARYQEITTGIPREVKKNDRSK